MREEAVTFAGGADGAVDVACGGEGEGEFKNACV